MAGIKDFDAQYARALTLVKTDAGLGALLGAKSTPTFFINGRMIAGAMPGPFMFETAIEQELRSTSRPDRREAASRSFRDDARALGFTGAPCSINASAIRIEDLTKDYSVGFWRKRPYRALDRLSLDVEPGEVFGFLGPNGAGKTTTLKLLMQLIFPTSGHAEILGRPVGDVGVRQRIGYLPENPYFYDYLTAEELLHVLRAPVRLLAAPDGARPRGARCSIASASAPSARLQLRKFSKGMIQRVGIAQALLNDPEVIFLDEPMSGLDPLGRRDVRALILELRDQGRTVFFSSHILADAEALCSRVAVVAGGRLAAAGRLTDILAFQVRGWELVIDDLPARCSRGSRRSVPSEHRDRAGALRARAAARPSARAVARAS